MKKKTKVPPADIILDVINGKTCADEKILKFYEKYILAAANEPHYNASGEYLGQYVNEDLAQDIRLAIFKCLPSLRKAFQKNFFEESPVIIVIAK